MKPACLFLTLALVLALARTDSYASAGGGGGGGGNAGGGYADHSAFEKARNVQNLYQQGVDAGNKGDFAGAIGFFEQALQLDPNNADTLNMLAHAQRKTGKMEESFENYRKALQIRPDFPEAREYLGEAYLQAALQQMDILKTEGKTGQDQLRLLQAALLKASQSLKASPSGTPDSDY